MEMQKKPKEEQHVKRLQIVTRIICFTLLAVILFVAIQMVFLPKYIMSNSHYPLGECLEELQGLNANSVQVLFMGSSHMYHGITPMQLYQDYGLTSFDLCAEGMPMGAAYTLLKKALETQTPEVVVMDVSSLFVTDIDRNSKWLIIMDSLPLFSPERFEIVRNYLKSTDYNEGDATKNRLSPLECYLPLFRTHDRWNDLKQQDFYAFTGDQIYSGFKGHLTSNTSSSSVINIEGMNSVAISMEKEPWTEVTAYIDGSMQTIWEASDPIYEVKIDEDGLYWLLEIQKLCQENDIQLLTTKIPVLENPVSYRSCWTTQRHTAMQQIAAENDLEFLDLMYDANVEIDWSRDTHDGGKHLNILGAEKVTDFIGKYLTEQYNLTPRIDDIYSQDLEVYQKTLDTMHLQLEQDFCTYLNRLKSSNRDLTIFMTACQDISAGITTEEKEALSAIGLQTDFSSMDFADTFLAVWEHSSQGEDRIVYEAASNRMLEYEYTLPNESEVYLMSKGGYEYADASVVLNGNACIPRLSGLWFVVYDNEAEIIIDHAGYNLWANDAHPATHSWSNTFIRNYEKYILNVVM